MFSDFAVVVFSFVFEETTVHHTRMCGRISVSIFESKFGFPANIFTNNNLISHLADKIAINFLLFFLNYHNYPFLIITRRKKISKQFKISSYH